MGFNAWRNLSALAFAGVALIGCNNGAQKDNGVAKGPPVGTAQTAQNAPGFSTGQPQPFPTQPKTPPFTPASASGSSSQFGSAPGPGSPPPFGSSPGLTGMPPGGPGALAPLPPPNQPFNPTQPNTGGFTPGPASGPPTFPSVVPPLPPSGSFGSQNTSSSSTPFPSNGGLPNGPVNIPPYK